MKKTKKTKNTLDGILLVKVGSDERPAGPSDIESVKKSLVIKDVDMIVSHHAIDFVMIPRLKPFQTLVWKIGNDNRPASVEDMKAFEKLLAEVASSESGTIVTHHAVDFVIVDNRYFAKVS